MIFYFGCGETVGHYIFGKGDAGIKHYLKYYDGRMAPPFAGKYIAAMSRLGHIGYSALSWWDQTVDTREGSNSILFTDDLNITFNEFILLGKQEFPWVFKRLPQELIEYERS